MVWYVAVIMACIFMMGTCALVRFASLLISVIFKYNNPVLKTINMICAYGAVISFLLMFLFAIIADIIM